MSSLNRPDKIPKANYEFQLNKAFAIYVCSIFFFVKFGHASQSNFSSFTHNVVLHQEMESNTTLALYYTLPEHNHLRWSTQPEDSTS